MGDLPVVADFVYVKAYVTKVLLSITSIFLLSIQSLPSAK